MPDIEFPTSAGTAPGYFAVPSGERGPATIVLQEWWGVDAHVRSICDRFADAGFFALAPDLFRGETTTQPSEAEQKMMALSMDQAEKDMCGAADYLLSQPGVEGEGVGSVGFCLGRRAVGVGGGHVPEHRGGGLLLLRDAPRQAGLHEGQGTGAGALRDGRRVHPAGGRQEARGRDARCRCRDDLPLLRGRRSRVLQRHRPHGHLRQRSRRALLGAHRRASCAHRWPPEQRLSDPRAHLRGLRAAGGSSPAAPLPAAAAPSLWAPPALLSACAPAAAPLVVFPS